MNSSLLFAASITEEPTSVNAALNSLAEFKCSTTGLSMLWFLNGEPAIQEGGITIDNSHLTGGGVEGTLTIPASEEYNNTEIVCRVENTDLTDEFTQTATLVVQGKKQPNGLHEPIRESCSSALGPHCFSPHYLGTVKVLAMIVATYNVHVHNTYVFTRIILRHFR